MDTTVTVFILLAMCLFICAEGKCRGKTRCTGLRDCAPYMALVQGTPKPLKPSVVNFLRARECGFSNGYPKVCCGVIPSGIKLFKNFKPTPKTEVSINKLSNIQVESEKFDYKITTESSNKIEGVKMTKFQRGMTPSFDITVSTAPPYATVIPYLDFKAKQKKMDELNRAFSETTDFDFFVRRVRSSIDSGLDIEVR